MKCLTDNDKINIGILVIPSARIEKEGNNQMSLSQESKFLTPLCAVSYQQKGQIKNASEALSFSIFRMLNKNIDLRISRQPSLRCLPSLFC